MRCDVTDFHGTSRNVNSYGKRKKRSASSSAMFDQGHGGPPTEAGQDNQDVMVAGVIRISDKFELETDPKSESVWSEECKNENSHSASDKHTDDNNAGSRYGSLGSKSDEF